MTILTCLPVSRGGWASGCSNGGSSTTGPPVPTVNVPVMFEWMRQ